MKYPQDIRYIIYSIKDKSAKKLAGETYLLSKGWTIDPTSTKKYQIDNGGRLVKYGFQSAIEHQHWRDLEDYHRAIGRDAAKKLSNAELIDALHILPDDWDDERYGFDEQINELKERLTKIGFI